MTDLDALAAGPRVRVRRPGPPGPDGACVVYWMQRTMRPRDNPALETAVAAANALELPLVTVFCLIADYPHANLRHYDFLAQGLADVAAGLGRRGIGFVLRHGSRDEVARCCRAVRAALLVGDENPIREMEAWRARVAAAVRIPFWTVDADVVVPGALVASPAAGRRFAGEQYAARTIRPRLMRQLEWFLVAEPARPVRVRWRGQVSPADALRLPEGLGIDRRVGPVTGWKGGARAGRAALGAFVRERLAGYGEARNHPERDGTSRLSPYLHFGHLGPREVALAVRDAGGVPLADRHAFLEQLIVRRELAVNFVRFNPAYDRLEGCESWACATLRRHAADPRDPRYTERQLEQAETHDPLWNAAQCQMIETGWMHGYVRMYWAKKILEWTRSPADAFAIAVRLNDRYELDGRDPNGYAGIAWAIGGKHDRAWGPERPVFGTVRYMSLASTSRKFDSRAYIRRWTGRDG